MLGRIFRHRATGRLRTLDRQTSIYLADEIEGWVWTDVHVGRETERQSTFRQMDTWKVDGWKDGRMDGWKKGCRNGCMEDQLHIIYLQRRIVRADLSRTYVQDT